MSEATQLTSSDDQTLARALADSTHVDRDVFVSMIQKGRIDGVLHAEVLVEALKSIELSYELIEGVVALLEGNGIKVDDLDASAELRLEDRKLGPAEGRGRRATARPGRRLAEGTTSGASTDAMRMYLKEIGKVPLLGAQREVELAKAVAEGLVAAAKIIELEDAQGDDIPIDVLTPLEAAVAIGLEAKQDIIEANLRLVVSVAKRYRNRGMAFLDLIQEGNCGLMRAVDKFDYTKGFKFSTYATWWIRQAITRAIADQARTIRIPVHMVETINKVVRTLRQMNQEMGREPTLQELGQATDLSVDKVREILRWNQDTVSLEQPMGEDDFMLGDTIEDRDAAVPVEEATRTLLREAITQAISELNEREQRVVKMRFGLEDGQIRTLEEVGREFGVTRERVRQIETKTLAKLRHPMRGASLKEYLGE